jgi:hypothetical protein
MDSSTNRESKLLYIRAASIIVFSTLFWKDVFFSMNSQCFEQRFIRVRDQTRIDGIFRSCGGFADTVTWS